MKGQRDHHVQAWVRDRVLVLEMLEELHSLTCNPCACDMRRAKRREMNRACGRFEYVEDCGR